MKALITGASTGIGRAIALRLAQDGYDIIATARNEAQLNELKEACPTAVTVIPADLSSRDACFKLWDAVKNEDIDILVNNAGFGVFGAFDVTDLSAELSMLDVNIDALHIFTKLFFKKFLDENKGYILNVSSAASFLPGPFFSSYYASKAYVLRLTLAIREEARRAGKNVYVGALCPGPVQTEFNARAHARFAVKGQTADFVAGYTVKQMFKNKAVIIPGAFMKFGRVFSKLAPDALLVRVAYYLQKRKHV